MHNTRKSLLGLFTGGFFVLLPVLLVGLVLEKMYHTLQPVAHSLLDELPGEIFRNPAIRDLGAVAAVAAMLLLVGLLARTRMGQAIGHWLETGLLNRLPFYAMLRSLASGLAGKEDDSSMKPVMVTVNPGLQQMGLLVERHADGCGTVFLPSSPNPGSGTVLVVEASLISELHIPSHRIFNSLSRWGYGTMTVLATARDRESKNKTDEPNRTK